MEKQVAIMKTDEAGEKKRRTKSEMLTELMDTVGEDALHGLTLEFYGEPAKNENTNLLLIALAPYGVRPVVETTLPKGEDEKTELYLNALVNIMNEDYKGTGCIIKLMLGSTSEGVRKNLFGNVISLTELSKLLEEGKMPEIKNGGKLVLAFDAERTVDVQKVARLFSPERCAISLYQEEDALPLGHKELEEAFTGKGFSIFYEQETE